MTKNWNQGGPALIKHFGIHGFAVVQWKFFSENILYTKSAVHKNKYPANVNGRPKKQT